MNPKSNSDPNRGSHSADRAGGISPNLQPPQRPAAADKALRAGPPILPKAEGLDGVLVRKGRRQDVEFIFHNWQREMYSAKKAMDKPTYRYYHHKLAEALVLQSDVRVLCDERDTNTVYGFIVGQLIGKELVVHFTYVKPAFRGHGMATALLTALRDCYEDGKDLPLTFTERTSMFWIDRGNETPRNLHEYCKDRGYKYNEYLAYAKLPEGWAE